MSKIQTLRGFMQQRLSSAAEEIFELFERTIAEYEEQLCRAKEENERQHKLLEAAYDPEVRLHRADVQALLVKTENVPAEQQERGPSLDQEDPPEPAHIKEEEEKLWRHQETQHLHGLKEEEEETSEFTLTPVPAKNEEGEEAQSSQLDENQTEEMLDCESETDDSSDYLEESAQPQSGLNHVSDMESNTVETAVSVSERATSSGPKEPEPDTKKIQKKEKTLSCSVCGKCYRKKSHLFRHEKTHKGDHGGLSGQNQLHKKEAANSDVTCNSERNQDSSCDSETKSNQKKEPQEHKEIPKTEKPFCCSVCNGRFTKKAHLKEHMGRHSGERPFCCSVCKKNFKSKGDLKKHTFSHSGERPHSCSVCGKTFTRGGHLKQHMSRHSGKRPHSCSVCKKNFKTQGNLTKHTFIHSGERPHSCSVCKKKFKTKSELTQHTFIHSGEKPHSCSVCGKTFTTGAHLKQHMSRHSGKRPHSCSVCGKTFTRGGHLKQHMSRHSGKRPHSCSVCKKRFKTKGNLTRHTFIHSGERPHSCSLCGKTFTRGAHLKRHMSLHSGKRPFSCSVCGKSYSYPQSLRIHSFIHTGEKPFSCSVCDKCFSQSDKFKNHRCEAESSKCKRNLKNLVESC